MTTNKASKTSPRNRKVDWQLVIAQALDGEIVRLVHKNVRYLRYLALAAGYRAGVQVTTAVRGRYLYVSAV